MSGGRLPGRRQQLAAALLATSVMAVPAWHAADADPAGAGSEVAGPMAQNLSSKLSPKAKKAVLLGAEEPVVCLVQLGPAAERADLERNVRALGGSVQSWNAETDLAAIEISTSRLSELAELDGVVYVEVGERYQR